MITLPLRMRYGEKPLRQPAAWLIPGADPRVWLDEMLAWQVPLGGAVLYQVPALGTRSLAAGRAGCSAPGLAPRITHRSQAYAAFVVPPLGGTPPPKGGTTNGGTTNGVVVYLPVEARMDPDASDSEVAKLAAEGGDCILHPTLGRIRLEPDDRRRVVDLLAAPPQRPARWDLAEPGRHVNSRLTAIVPAEVPSLEQMLDAGRDDIGRESPTLEQLPPEPGEPSSGLFSKLARDVQRRLARIIQKMAEGGEGKQPPGGKGQAGAGSAAAAGRRPGKPGLFSKMADWARKTMGQIDDSLRKSRHRELHRLMHLLQNDPDQGLRFALPCGEGRHRGIARPSGTLSSRSVNFDLRRLGGGGPADPWELPGDLYVRLRAKYMELAGREMRLGRYRRAAYIYGHLLGDFTNAAAALVAGKHFREAAVLYRDRLDRPEMAAKCLEQGGLWAEAIEFYEQLGDFEKVGDLYSQLEQAEEAEKAWRRAVEKLEGTHDRTAAAKLLETKLKAPDEALAVLAGGWPASPQAGACLAAEFALLGRLGRHEAAHRRVDEIRRQPLEEAVRQRAVDILVENARGYPQETVREVAADATRTIVARHLREASGSELDRLLEAVRRLAPADRLLDRDTSRYLRYRRQPPRPAAKPPQRTVVPQPPAAGLKRLGEIALGRAVKWERAVSCGDHFYAAGFQDGALCLTQSSWSGQQRTQRRTCPQTDNFILAFDRCGGEAGVLHLVGGPRLPAMFFVAWQAVMLDCTVGCPAWVPDAAVGIDFSTNGTKHVLATTDDGLALTTLDANAKPARSQLITYESLWPGEGVAGPPVLPVPMCTRDLGVYLGVGDRLVRVTGAKTPQVFNMPGTIHSLSGSMPYSVSRIVATLEQGAALQWGAGLAVVRFAEELAFPVAAITTSGWIVLASSAEVQVYKTEGRKIHLVCAQGRNVRPVAALATADPDGFAIVREDGVVEQYQMPRR